MADVRISLGRCIGDSDVLKVRNTLNDLGSNDEITIRLEAADAHQAGRITDELARQNFDYQPHGGDGHQFYFTAKRRV